MIGAKRGAAVAALTAGVLLLLPAVATADFDVPVKKKVDCSKPENKDKPACQKKSSEGPDRDELYQAAYWLAKDGRYAAALELLAGSRDSADPRLLTVIGFATRKLGDVEAALPYYLRALDLDPTLTATREYLGEAYLALGDLAAAERQLDEVARRAGRASEPYAKLSAAIAAYKAEPNPRG